MEKDWSKRPSDHQLQEAGKKTDRAVTPVVEAVHVSAHLALPGPLQAKQLCHRYTQLSLGQSCHRKKSMSSMHARSLQSCPTLDDPVDCGLPGVSVRKWGSPRKNTGADWPILVAIPSQFSSVARSCPTLLEDHISCCPSCQLPEYLVLPEPL